MTGKNRTDRFTKSLLEWKNFTHLSKAEIQYVSQNMYDAVFKPGEIMLKQGSPASNALFLSSGLAKIYMEGANGKNVIMNIIKPGMVITGPGVYFTSRQTYTVSALTAVHAFFLSFEIFRQLLKKNGNFAESLIEDISSKWLAMHTRMLSLIQKKMPGRLAEAILYLSEDIFDSHEFDIILSRQEMGEMTNMAKECVVRIIKEFEGSEILISKGSRIKILDKTKLKLISERG